MIEHVEPFLETLRARNASENTIKSYRTACLAWCKAGCPPADEWMSHLAETGKPATVAQRRKGLVALHRYLIERGLAETNPFEPLAVIKDTQRVLRVLTLNEVARLINACDRVGQNGARLAAMVSLIATSGLRVSEATGMRLDGLDLENRTAHVMGKGAKERIVKFGVVAQEKIRAYLEERPDVESPWLFCAASGSQVNPNHFREDLEKAAWWADLKDINPHLLRHTFATMSVAAKLPIEDVRVMLGHESILTTQRYIHRDHTAAWSGYDRHPLAGGGEAA